MPRPRRSWSPQGWPSCRPLRPTGIFIVIGETPAGPLYLELIEPDATFPAFQHCPRLFTG